MQALGRAPEPSRRAGGGISFALGDLRLRSPRHGHSSAQFAHAGRARVAWQLGLAGGVRGVTALLVHRIHRLRPWIRLVIAYHAPRTVAVVEICDAVDDAPAEAAARDHAACGWRRTRAARAAAAAAEGARACSARWTLADPMAGRAARRTLACVLYTAARMHEATIWCMCVYPS